MKPLLTILIFLLGSEAFAQAQPVGIVMGNVLGENGKALELATVQVLNLNDSLVKKSTTTDKDGAFRISGIPFGYYRLTVSFVGFQPLSIDSIYFREERYDFNLNDVVLKRPAGDSGMMEQVIIFFEKPLIESKDGNITFNAGQSALSAGSNASDLLTTVPLVTKDPDGKLLVRGKEPRILIDEKPVDLSLEQLQDLLESMPGSSIDKIEVMTNPPAEYASEEGGVINIVTKRGTVGKSGRLSVYAGSRGERGANASFNYRKKGLSLNVIGGLGSNSYRGNGYSHRQNLYKDSVNYFNSVSNYSNQNLRPNFRTRLNYDINKFHAVDLVLNYNQNEYTNRNFTENTNLNYGNEIFRLSERTQDNSGAHHNGSVQLGYTMKTRKPGEALKFFGNLNTSASEGQRNFYQQYFFSDHAPNGVDSTQQQQTSNQSTGYNLRLNYNLPLQNEKTVFSAGGSYSGSTANVKSDASYLRKTDEAWLPLTALINEFSFRQQISSYRASVRQKMGAGFTTMAGISAEYTHFNFDLAKNNSGSTNAYWSYLPFARVRKSWEDKIDLTLSYRKTIRRPGSGQLNPTIDSASAYSIRVGNPELKPSMSHNFDLVVGRNKNSFYTNLALGYNRVDDVFAQIRTALTDTTTKVTWENISGRKEYQVSTWSGYTLNRHTRVSLSASYSYNVYSAYDRTQRNYRNGGTFTSNLNGNYRWQDLYTLTGSFTFNRFANPQGSVRGSLSMNMGFQARMLNKKLTATLNVTDPFVQHQNKRLTYTERFILESYSSTRSRNFRLTLAYTFSKSQKKKGVDRDELKKLLNSKSY